MARIEAGRKGGREGGREGGRYASILCSTELNKGWTERFRCLKRLSRCVCVTE